MLVDKIKPNPFIWIETDDVSFIQAGFFGDS